MESNRDDDEERRPRFYVWDLRAREAFRRQPEKVAKINEGDVARHAYAWLHFTLTLPMFGTKVALEGV